MERYILIFLLISYNTLEGDAISGAVLGVENDRSGSVHYFKSKKMSFSRLQNCEISEEEWLSLSHNVFQVEKRVAAVLILLTALQTINRQKTAFRRCYTGCC